MENNNITPTTAYAYYARGYDHSRQGNYDQAIADFTKAIEMDPLFYQAYIKRGIAYKEKGDVGQATSAFTQAITVKPGDTEGYFYRGWCYSILHKYDEAIVDYTMVIHMKSWMAGWTDYGMRGDIYAVQGKYDQAIADYLDAISLCDGYDPWAQRAPFFYDISRAYYHKKDYNKAWENMLKAKEYGAAIDQDYLDKLKRAYDSRVIKSSKKYNHPISREDAIRIAEEQHGPGIEIFEVLEGRPKGIILADWDWKKVWCVLCSYTPGRQESFCNSRAIVISKETGEVLFDGSAHDEG